MLLIEKDQEIEKVVEISPGIFKEGNEFVFNPKITVPEGVRRGLKLLGPSIQNRKTLFNEDFILSLHKEVMYYFPETAGKYRLDEEVRIQTRDSDDNGATYRSFPVAHWKLLPARMHLFGRWFETRMEQLKNRPEDLIGALKLASEVHYGLTSPDLHPFNDGNGRVARLLANAVLMLNAHELVFYGIKILPIPLVRDNVLSQVNLCETKDPYLKALYQTYQSKDLAHFDVFIASLWSNNLSHLMVEYTKRLKNQSINKISPADFNLIKKFQRRANLLDRFVINQFKSDRQPHLVPDYFELRYIR